MISLQWAFTNSLELNLQSARAHRYPMFIPMQKAQTASSSHRGLVQGRCVVKEQGGRSGVARLEMLKDILRSCEPVVVIFVQNVSLVH